MGLEVAHPPEDTRAVVTVPALLSVATVGRLLDRSPKTVRRRIADGTIPAVVEDGRMMVRADELREYILGLSRPGPGRRRTVRTRAAVGGDFDFLRA